MIGSGNFGGKRSPENSNIVQGIKVPSRSPDAIVFQRTNPEQASG